MEDSIRWHLDTKSLSRAFLHASIANNLKLMEVLLSRGAEANETDHKGHTPLMNASQRGDVERVKILLNAKADVNACPDDHHSALTLASVKGHLDIVNLLIGGGADLNAVTLKGIKVISFLFGLELKLNKHSIELCSFCREDGDSGPFTPRKLST